MRVGVMTVLYHGLELTEALDRIAALGVRSVELATATTSATPTPTRPGCSRIDARLEALRQALDEREMTISALSEHGNPLHPDAAIAAAHHETWRKTLGLRRPSRSTGRRTFSGCPGDGQRRAPNGSRARGRRSTGPPGVAVERAGHPVLARAGRARPARRRADRARDAPRASWSTTRRALRLRAAVGADVVGCRLRPEPPRLAGHRRGRAAKAIGAAGAISQCTRRTPTRRRNVAVNGVLDTKSYRQVAERAGCSAGSVTGRAKACGAACERGRGGRLRRRGLDRARGRPDDRRRRPREGRPVPPRERLEERRTVAFSA